MALSPSPLSETCLRTTCGGDLELKVRNSTSVVAAGSAHAFVAEHPPLVRINLTHPQDRQRAGPRQCWGKPERAESTDELDFNAAHPTLLRAPPRRCRRSNKGGLARLRTERRELISPVVDD